MLRRGRRAMLLLIKTEKGGVGHRKGTQCISDDSKKYVVFKNKASRSLDLNSPAISSLFVWSLSPHLLGPAVG